MAGAMAGGPAGAAAGAVAGAVVAKKLESLGVTVISITVPKTPSSTITGTTQIEKESRVKKE